MAYEFYSSYLSSTPAANYFKDSLQQLINAEFTNAPNIYTIKRYDRTISAWEDVQVRITVPHKIENEGSIKDDFRILLFKDNKAIYLGDMFEFDNYRWICIDTGNLSTNTNSCMIQRCNILLKFIPNNNAVMPMLSATPIEVWGVGSKYVLSPNRSQMISVLENQMIVKISNCADSRLIKYQSGSGTRFLLGNPLQCWNCISMDYLQDVRPMVNNSYFTCVLGSTFPYSVEKDINGIINIKIQLSQINNTTDNTFLSIAKQNCY